MLTKSGNLINFICSKKLGPCPLPPPIPPPPSLVTAAVCNFSSCAGIQAALVGLLAQKAEVKYEPTQISLEQIAAEIASIGFEAEAIGDDDKAQLDLLVGNIEHPGVGYTKGK